MKIKAAYLTRYYDEVPLETEIDFPVEATESELIAHAKNTCEFVATHDDYFCTMKMQESPSDVSCDEDFFDVSFNFCEKDFATNMQVSYTLDNN